MRQNTEGGEARWLSVGHFNVRGLKSREVVVRELFEREKLDLLTMVETFRSPGTSHQLRGDLVELFNEKAGRVHRAELQSSSAKV